MSDFIPGVIPEKTLFLVGVKAVITYPPTGKILVLTRSQNVHYGGSLDLPGGNLESGELPVLGIEREIKEETDLTCTDFKIIDTVTLNHDNHQLLLIGLSCNADTESVTLNWESSSFQWLSPEEALNSPLPQTFKDFIQKTLS